MGYQLRRRRRRRQIRRRRRRQKDIKLYNRVVNCNKLESNDIDILTARGYWVRTERVTSFRRDNLREKNKKLYSLFIIWVFLFLSLYNISCLYADFNIGFESEAIYWENFYSAVSQTKKKN